MSSPLQSALLLSSEGVQLGQMPMPVPAPGEALVRVLRSGVCSTDLHMVAGYKDGYRGCLGHEFVGEVVEGGGSLLGKRVVGEINIRCKRCSVCLAAESSPEAAARSRNHCPHRRCLGIVGKDGVHAQYLTLPVDNLHLVSEHVSDRAAVFAEPLAAALRLVEQHVIGAGSGKSVAIVGDGKLGLLVLIALCSLKPALQRETVLLGRHPEKMALGVELVDPLPGRVRTIRVTPNLLEQSSELRRVFDVVVASRAQNSTASWVTQAPSTRAYLIRSCVALIRMDVGGERLAERPGSSSCDCATYGQFCGTVVLKTTCSAAAPSEGAASAAVVPRDVLNDVVVHEINLQGSRCGPFAPALRMLEERGEFFERLVAAQFPLCEAKRALRYAGQRGILKVQIVMPPPTDQADDAEQGAPHRYDNKGTALVAENGENAL